MSRREARRSGPRASRSGVAAIAVALSVAALVIAPAPALGVSDVFIQPPTSPEGAGDMPASIISGDFNGDSYGDLAVANRDSDDVTILLGDGLGDFTPAATSPEAAGDGPSSVVASWFNGDANTDLVVANRDSDDVTILLGDGTGDFTPAPTSPEAVGDAPTSVVAAYLGPPPSAIDLAVANGGDDNVSILLGDGLGDFTPAPTSPEAVGDAPSSVLASYFNDGGVLDLAVANGGDDNVSILLSAAGGDYTPAATSPEVVGDAPTSLLLIKPGLAPFTGLYVANSGDDNLSTLSGFQGLADFTANSPPIPVGDRPTGVVGPGSLPYDEQPPGVASLAYSLAVANGGSDNISILGGDFTPEAAGDGPTSLTIFRRTPSQRGRDLAVANADSDNVSILLNDVVQLPALLPALPPAQAAPTGNPVQLKKCIKKAKRRHKGNPAKKKRAIKKCKKRYD